MKKYVELRSRILALCQPVDEVTESIRSLLKICKISYAYLKSLSTIFLSLRQKKTQYFVFVKTNIILYLCVLNFLFENFTAVFTNHEQLHACNKKNCRRKKKLVFYFSYELTYTHSIAYSVCFRLF